MTGRERLIYALDVPSAEQALEWVERLSGAVGAFKVGLELFVSAGPELVRQLVARQQPVFLDLKFHDIPATVAGACRAAGRFGATLINVHGLAGPQALVQAAQAARTGAEEAGMPAPRVLAVTILTSHRERDLAAIGLGGPPAEAVLRLVRLARLAGLDGVVASPLEAASIRSQWPDGLIVTPGVRPAGAERGDQVRVATPAGAVVAGADYVVVGRPIRAAEDPVAAAQAIAAEMDAVGKAGSQTSASPAMQKFV